MATPTPLPAAVERYLDANRDGLVSSAEALLSRDTANPPGHTAAAASWLASRLEAAARSSKSSIAPSCWSMIRCFLAISASKSGESSTSSSSVRSSR